MDIFTALIAIGTIVAIIPGLPVISLLVGVQVVNGALLPVLLVFIWRLASDRELMGDYRNGPIFNVVAGLTVLATSALSITTRTRRFSHPAHRRPASCPVPEYPDETDLGGDSMTFTRITVRPDQMGGAPCLRGLRIPVATVVDMVADGMSKEEILAAYPDLEAEDIEEALHYAAEAVRERELPLAAAG